MKAITTAIFSISVVVVAWTQQAWAQNDSGPSPVEAFFCNMQEGKTMDDLLKVAGKFSKWADKNDPDYQKLLAVFGPVQKLLKQRPRADMPGFVMPPCSELKHTPK